MAVTDAATLELQALFDRLPPVGRWVAEAACRGQGALFTAYPQTLEAQETVERTCGACPVRADCLRYADEYPVDGVWSGEWRNTKPKWTAKAS